MQEYQESTTLDDETPQEGEVSGIRSDLERAFGADEDTQQAPAATQPTEPSEQQGQPGQQSQTTTPTAGDEPPARLRERFGAEWHALPPAVKQTFHEYETAIGRLGNRFGHAAREWNTIRQITAPYQQMIQSEPGGNLHGAIQNLFETARILRQGHPDQKTALVMGVLTRFQVPHQQLPDGRILLAPPTSDPRLLNQLSALQGQHLTQTGRQVHHAEQEVDEELEGFLSNPANVYTRISGYTDTMAALISQGRATSLEDAYQKAAWLHEESREVEIAKRNQANLSRRSEQANAARAAAVSVPGNSPGTTQQSTAAMSLRQELAARLAGDLA